jgi:hypothetical protein
MLLLLLAENLGDNRLPGNHHTGRSARTMQRSFGLDDVGLAPKTLHGVLPHVPAACAWPRRDGQGRVVNGLLFALGATNALLADAQPRDPHSASGTTPPPSATPPLAAEKKTVQRRKRKVVL